MENSKLVALLRTFSNSEWRRFLDLVSSPFFNTRPELLKLAEYLELRSPSLAGPELDKEAIFVELYPDEPFDNKQMGYLMNYLLRLGEQFLGLERLINDSLVLTFQTMTALRERELDKHFHFLLNRGLKELDKHFPESSEKYQYCFQLLRLKSEESTRQGDLKQDIIRGEARSALDAYHVLETLKLGCERHRYQSISSAHNGLVNLSWIEQYLVEGSEAPPLVAMYRSLYLSLTTEDAEKALRDLLGLIRAHAEHVDRGELEVLFQYATEHCVHLLRQGNRSFAAIALEFFQEGLRNEIFMEQGEIQPDTLLGIVDLYLGMNDPSGASGFVREYKGFLPPAGKDQVVDLASSMVDFQTGQYGRAVDRLTENDFRDLRFFVRAMILRIKVHYATQNLDRLLSDLAELTLFVRKDKTLDPDYRKEVNEFCAFLHQVLRRNPKKRAVLQQQIEENEAVREREWLLKVLEQEVH